MFSIMSHQASDLGTQHGSLRQTGRALLVLQEFDKAVAQDEMQAALQKLLDRPESSDGGKGQGTWHPGLGKALNQLVRLVDHQPSTNHD